MSPETSSRWRYAAAAFSLQICLGALYAWSVFRGPLGAHYGWTKAETIAPYRYSLLCFTIGMIGAGLWQDRQGPRLVATVGGLLLAGGCALAGVFGGTVNGLILTYGVVAGLGIGCAYVTPIAMCIKWYPDHRGAITGFNVAGFGLGTLLFGPLLERLIGKDPAQMGVTLPTAFFTLAGIFLVFGVGAARLFRLPPPGWRPPHWMPPTTTNARVEFALAEVLRTWQFYALWIFFFAGSAIGLTVIGEAGPLLARHSAGAFLAAGAALGVMSTVNGVGRLFWGAVSDRIGRTRTTALLFACFALTAYFVLRPVDTFGATLAGLCGIALGYSGFFSVMPSFAVDFYGPKNLGANYGVLFTAYGLAGFFVPGIVNQSLQSGVAYGTIFSAMAAVAALGMGAVLLLKRPA